MIEIHAEIARGRKKLKIIHTRTVLTRIWHVPAKHANRMDARAHSSTLAECAPRFMTRGTNGFVGQTDGRTDRFAISVWR